MVAAGSKAQAPEWSVGLASATVQRGIALGEGGVDVRIDATLAPADGWRFGLGATALHRRASAERRDAEWYGRVGHAQRLEGDWSLQLAWTRYGYRGAPILRLYAHDELGATLAFSDSLYLSLAGLRGTRPEPGYPRDSAAADLVLRQALPAGVSVHAGIGRLEPRRVGAAYAYGHVGLAANWRATQLQLSYVLADASARRQYGPAAGHRWVAALVWQP